MGSEVTETNTSKINLDEHGIVHVVKKPGSEERLDDAKENVDAIIKICNNTSHPAYIDLTCMKSQYEEAVVYYGEMAQSASCFACAFLIGDMQSTALGRANVELSDPKISTALFTSEEQAIKWLKQFL